MSREKQELVFTIPWVTGPDGFERPFGLDTKYGHLVFVFLEQNDLYRDYFAGSEANLAAGYNLETAAVFANSRKQLNEELAKRMPPNKKFGVVLEGTDSFYSLMNELFADTIWSEE